MYNPKPIIAAALLLAGTVGCRFDGVTSSLQKSTAADNHSNPPSGADCKPHHVPDAGTTAGLLGGSLVALAIARRRLA